MLYICLSLDEAYWILYEDLQPLTRNLITQFAALGCCHSTCTGENSACITGLQKETNI